MGFTNFHQVRLLFLSAGMGFLTGIYYDVFRLWRRLFSVSRFSVFLQDVFFGGTSAVAFFLFSLAFTEGAVRGYALIAAAIGFLAYRYTVGNALVNGVSRLIRLCKRVNQWVYQRMMSPLLNSVTRLFAKVSEKCRKLAKKTKIFFKKVLQRKGKIVYNHRV